MEPEQTQPVKRGQGVDYEPAHSPRYAGGCCWPAAAADGAAPWAGLLGAGRPGALRRRLASQLASHAWRRAPSAAAGSRAAAEEEADQALEEEMGKDVDATDYKPWEE